MYDTDLKRFYSVDPLLQFASPYCYVGNNPISFVDPTGMSGYWTINEGWIRYVYYDNELGQWVEEYIITYAWCWVEDDYDYSSGYGSGGSGGTEVIKYGIGGGGSNPNNNTNTTQQGDSTTDNTNTNTDNGTSLRLNNTAIYIHAVASAIIAGGGALIFVNVNPYAGGILLVGGVGCICLDFFTWISVQTTNIHIANQGGFHYAPKNN